MKTYDAAIIGAGIVGAACAAALAREGLSIILIDANGVAGGTTAAGMGHIVVMDDSPAQFALTKYSQQLWKKLSDELPRSCEYLHCGTIWIAADEEEMQEVRRKEGLYSSNGLQTTILDAKALNAAESNLADDLYGGLLVESDGVVYQLAATRYLADLAKRHGAAVRDAEPVSKIADGDVSLRSGESVSCGLVINAAGAAAADLTPELKIRKRKGHLVITERYPNFARHQLVELGYLKSAHGNQADSVAFNVQPRSTGQVLLGSSRQIDVDDRQIDHDILRRMTSRAFRYMPKLKELQATRIWTGSRPTTPDNLPYIGKVPGYKSVYAAAGHEGLGITTSLATAALLADEIMSRKPPIPPEPYSPNRLFTYAHQDQRKTT
jgi:glycine/D-amino acid oxidase-like deaminating enzyme